MLGGLGGPQPPQILGNSDVLGSKRNLGKASLKKKEVSMFLFFEEIDIFYFNPKSAC